MEIESWISRGGKNKEGNRVGIIKIQGRIVLKYYNKNYCYILLVYVGKYK